MNRNLDGLYFCINNENICFSDMSEQQMEYVMEDKGVEWLKSMCVILGKTIREIGDEYNLKGEI